ncbi:hypothetical protein BUALT_Bualt19G0007300 [Buddleja alternifolia]|uniref:WRKY domain-containing protein n=1 Tax=Buddleja alternifolia TaxID=168488 RepID=A0AAV6W1R5_9LAMI|nr:hypothetical protein BUALT_Bualt19G0007300 [Buddleja alternifolia]
MHDLYKPFFQKLPESSQVLLPPHRLPIPPLSVQDLSSEQQITKQLPQKQQLFSVGNGSKSTVSSRSKKRKNNLKKVCHVAAENLSCDMWSWRKYGQKPIKGSPYPRGYYKCSTLKGCMARKQVERNKSDPGMFIVTYTAEHNHPMPTHRSSLAGSTRHKPEDTPNSDDPKKPSCSSEMSPEMNFSPAPEKLESSRDDVAEAEDEDDDFSVSDMAVEDDFFAGLEDFAGQGSEECDSDQFPAKLEFPWVVDNATAAAAGGG